MLDLSVYAPRLVNKEEKFASGHRACIGCCEALAMRQAFKAMDRNIIVANATGCMEIIASQLPYTSWEVPWIHTLFENTAAVASGVEAGLKAMERKGLKPKRGTKVVAIGGDGATADIGLQAISGAFERGHDLLYICFDNEAYMNTGIQRSSATPFGASTTTSPAGKVSLGQFSWKKDVPAIAVAHNISYVATACPSYPFDLMEKVKRGLEVNGPAYIHIFSVCPTGWRSAAELGIRLGRLAVETGVFPLYEVVNGAYKINVKVPKFRPVKDYLKLQGRFRHLPKEAIQKIQDTVIQRYHQLELKEQTRNSGETDE